MGHTESTQLVSSRTKGHISSLVVESKGAEKKAMAEQERKLSVTSSVKKRCFACHDTSHNLEQCGKKYKHTTMAYQFGYATKYPFTMIQPSKETVEKEKFYEHCVLITSSLSNFDLGILKSNLLKFWKLSGDWELRRECNKSFLVSLSSEDDLISCLENPKMKTMLDGKVVNFTVTRWNERDNESLDLDEEWFLVSGVPKIYRNWKELYQVASAFGVLIDVDVESLEVGDKEPIRLKIGSRSFDGTPFSYYFGFGWSSQLVMVTAVQDKREGMKHKNKELDKEHKKELNAAKSILLIAKAIEEASSNGKAKENKISSLAATITNSEITTTKISKPAGVQSTAPSPRSMIGEEHSRGTQKQKEELHASNSILLEEPEGIKESRSRGKVKENKISAPASAVTNSEIATTESSKPDVVQSISPSPRSMIGEEHFRGIQKQKEELNAEKSILLEKPKGIEDLSSNGKAKENKINAPAATITNSEKAAAESSKREGVQSIAPIPRSVIEEVHFRGIQKPPFIHVFQRRGKKKQVTEAINKSPANKMDKEVAPHSSSNATRTRASITGCDILEKDCSKMVPQRELNMEEITAVGESRKAEKLGACIDTEYNNVAAPTINSKKTQILGGTSRTPRDELIIKHTKSVGMDQMGLGDQVHQKEDASKIDTRLLPNSEEVGIYESFSEMGLQENLLKGIYQYGLEKPSAVHQRGIVPLCKGFGVVHQSLSGTTETICTGVLQRLDYGSAECQVLILVPTAYLAQEIAKVLGALGQFLGVTAQTCTGGTSADADQQTLSSRVQVLIGTPDCILDMLQRHALSPDHIRMLFLDEADELLSGGSKDQINNIILYLPKKIQVGLFSGTYSIEAIQTSRKFMDTQVAVIVPREEELKTVKQYYLEVEKEELKLGKLYGLFKATGMERLVIFVNTRDKAVSLAKDFSKHYAVSVSHDGMNQHARNRAIQKFNSVKSSSLLIATDNRGTNAMPEVHFIINYDVPTESMLYVRRLQQQNRQFRQPQTVVINLVTPDERRTQLAPITRFCKCSIGELPPMK